ncbi:MAG: OmpA family protein [Alphaproteobacteria bacterium]|nr:OmpA family protein [Alphaproteobacteria bacterium]MDE2337491.1 OmpA family protein [Alphaproteobacteria bacterium]
MKKSYRRRKESAQDAHINDWLLTYADMITLLLCFFAVFIAVRHPPRAPRDTANGWGVTDVFGNDRAQGNKPLVAPASEMIGDRIIALKMSSSLFFTAGSATLTPQGKTILRKEASILLSPQYEGYEITVEGHTDDTPVHTAEFPDNWVLSAARAGAVVKYFIKLGIDPQHLRAAGYADAFPLAPNRDADGKAIPANQAKNRRVVIKLQKIAAAE